MSEGRMSAWESSPQSKPCCCCCGIERRHKVSPLSDDHQNIVEIRPKRYLRIVHINAKHRDKEFEVDYENYLNVQSRRLELRRKKMQLIKANRLKQIELKKIADSKVKDQLGMDLDIPVQQQINRDQKKLREAVNGMVGEDGENPIAGSLTGQGDGVWQNRQQSENTEKVMADSYSEKVMADSYSEKVMRTADSYSEEESVATHTGDDKTSMMSRKGTATTLQNVDVHVAKSVQSSHQAENTPDNAQTAPIHNTDHVTSVEATAVIFLIHGVGGSADVWTGQARHFQTLGYELVIPDLLGHGFSSAPQQAKFYEFREIAEDLLAIFDKYSKRRNVVIGHSYGCSFAALLGRRRARWVSKLVMVSGGSPTPLAPQPGIFNMPLCLLSLCKPILTRGFKKSAFVEMKTCLSAERAFDVPTYVLKHTMQGQNWLEGGVEYHMMLNIPTLIIHGQQDRLVSLQEEEEMEKVVYGSRLEVLDGASHMVMMEKVEQVNGLILSFLLQDLPLLGSAQEHMKAATAHASPATAHASPTTAHASPTTAHASPTTRHTTKRRKASRSANMGSQVSLRSVKSIPANLVVNNMPYT